MCADNKNQFFSLKPYLFERCCLIKGAGSGKTNLAELFFSICPAFKSSKQHLLNPCCCLGAQSDSVTP